MPPARLRVYDFLHRAVVSGLIGFTFVSTGILVFEGAKWYVERKPQLDENRRLQKETALSLEQQEKEAELLQRQAAADRELLKD